METASAQHIFTNCTKKPKKKPKYQLYMVGVYCRIQMSAKTRMDI